MTGGGSEEHDARPRLGAGLLRWLPLAAPLLLALGFYSFYSTAAAFRSDKAAPADGIVVLTGGKGRIGAGIALLKAGKGRRLLISGVNANVPAVQFRKLLALEPGLSRRIDFGQAAVNTIGNARETAVWTARHRYRSLIVVTHDYHMSRTLSLFQMTMPDTALHPYAVESRAALTFWLREYFKYLAAGIAPGLSELHMRDHAVAS